MKPLVSVITPAHNAAAFLQAAIDSVRVQTLTSWEMVIVDDGSRDATADIIIRAAETDARIRLFRHPRALGAAAARNRAIKEARGRYIAFLDADDVWYPQKLERQIGFMRQEGVAFSYGTYDLIDESGRVTGRYCPPLRVTYRDLLKTCSIGCLTAVFDTAVFGKRYMPAMRNRQDFVLWLDLLKSTKEARGMAEPLGAYRLHATSLSAGKWRTAYYQWRVYRKVENLNLFSSLYYFFHYAYYGLRKYRFEDCEDA